jgi:hypothetical protein
MNDSVIALIEPVRLARLELHCYQGHRCAATPEWTIERLENLLLDPKVGEALNRLAGCRESLPRAAAERRARDGRVSESLKAIVRLFFWQLERFQYWFISNRLVSADLLSSAREIRNRSNTRPVRRKSG